MPAAWFEVGIQLNRSLNPVLILTRDKPRIPA